MNAGMKMLMLANREGGGNRPEGNTGRRGARAEMNMEYSGAYSEMRGGRGGPGNAGNRYGMRGGYEPDDRMGGYAAEERFRDRQGRERYDDGRFAPMRNGYEPEGNYNRSEGGRNEMKYEDAARNERRPMNRIGFALEPSGHDREYKETVENPEMNEMEHRTSATMMGHARAGGHTKLTKEMADEWMNGLENEDGSRGPHWTLEQAKQVMAQKGIGADPLEFWAALNAMYADYCKVFKKYGVGDKLDFYIDMAKAFIEDKDAASGKVAKYFESIVRG